MTTASSHVSPDFTLSNAAGVACKHEMPTFGLIILYLSKQTRGMFKVKSREKKMQVREDCSQQLEHKQVPKRDGTSSPEE